MPSRPSISIISAIYNAEKTLERCIESILSQTFQDFELLLVNDGSKDDSGKILDSYARYDNRIKVFHKNNEGVGATRQFGMDHSSGKYIIHIDPDDWIEPNTLELLYNAATLNSVGIAICNWTYFGPNGTGLKQHQKPSKLDSKSLIDDILNGKLLGGVCNKLISSTIAKNRRLNLE